jgi:signal peptidase I
MTNGSAPQAQDSDVVETIQSLIVAFVLAMTFRGFVTEGFVIPTGSMAPTLLGQHALIHSPQTGYTFAVGLDSPVQASVAMRLADPMLGEKFPGSGVAEKTPGSGVPKIRRPNGMGDRILVLKALYPFSQPKRFDVVVFKNPTDPVGDKSNYIKRLIGLPNEKIWLTDGDVFARPFPPGTQDDAPANFDTFAEYRIQRKPRHIQRAVWQTVYNSDFAPLHAQRLMQAHRYEGPPWVGDDAWNMTLNAGRTYASTSADATALVWDQSRRGVSDWTAYNMIAAMSPLYRIQPHVVNDVRISAGVVATQAGLKTTLELEARSHVFQFIIEHDSSGSAITTLRMRPSNRTNGEGGWIEEKGSVWLPAPGKVFNVEFWHVDQAMHMFIDGEPACRPLEYDWSPLQRLRYATGNLESNDFDTLINTPPRPARIRWRFEGSPVTLHRVRLDRDLNYRHDTLDPSRQQHQPGVHGHAFGTHPFSPQNHRGKLGPDQFMMCGDNSQLSLDSRLWGKPHPLVSAQIDESPFTVNRKLLIGKAWVVYFPAPFPLYDEGRSLVPDFGRLRFIR